jgi:hypothetical protein
MESMSHDEIQVSGSQVIVAVLGPLKGQARPGFWTRFLGAKNLSSKKGL